MFRNYGRYKGGRHKRPAPNSSYDSLCSPIISTPIPEERELEDPVHVHHPAEMEREGRTSCLVYLALVVVGIGGYIATNSLWIELPTLVGRLPEGRSLSVYLMCLLQTGNLAALSFTGARRCANNHLSEVPFLYISLVFSLASLILVGFFWHHTTIALGESHSIVFFICAFLAAQVTCLAPLTLIPFGARFRPVYITAVLLGEACAALIPHGVGIGQGLPTSPPCPEDLYPNRTRPAPRPHYGYFISTTPPPIVVPPQRFQEMIFFLSSAGLMGLAGFIFILLRLLPSVRFHYDEVHIDCMEEVELSRAPVADEPEQDELWTNTQCDGTTVILDDGSYRQSRLRPDGYSVRPSDPTKPPATFSGNHASPRDHLIKSHDQTRHHDSSTSSHDHHRHAGGHRERHHGAKTRPGHHDLNNKSRVRISSQSSSMSRHASTGSDAKHSEVTCDQIDARPPSFALLMVITMWASAILNGPLSSVKAHACIPLGNKAFMIGTILCNAMTIFTCIVGTRISPKSKVTLVVAVTALGTILLTYFVALISFSHASQSTDSAIFGSTGELLATIAWSAIVGLFSFAKVIILVLCRHSGKEAIVWFAMMTQVGAAIGAFCMVDRVSVCMVFRNYKIITPCKQF